jgi:hypothetical protein
MELAGGVISIVSLVGLVHTCNEAIEQFDSYRQFGYESRNIMTRFDLDKFLFRRWTDHVGIANNKLNEEHHPSLDDGKVASLISETLFSIKGILKCTEATSSALQRQRETENSPDFIDLLASLSKRPINQISNSASVSKRYKMSWALGKNTKFSKEVETFGLLVERLYRVVPIAVSESELRQWMDKVAGSLSGISVQIRIGRKYLTKNRRVKRNDKAI